MSIRPGLLMLTYNAASTKSSIADSSMKPGNGGWLKNTATALISSSGASSTSSLRTSLHVCQER